MSGAARAAGITRRRLIYAAKGQLSLCADTVQRLARYARVDVRTMKRWLGNTGKIPFSVAVKAHRCPECDRLRADNTRLILENRRYAEFMARFKAAIPAATSDGLISSARRAA